ncbi:D-lactate dehydrogenase [Coccidioides immitis RMSCC 3703]|uniref:D-lactate dehydrogenase n=1 Tax=Coccidioides immitis RMSCC 3703 TaxID=454286 RepID=A0A0J8QN35_COCIT|nr:D-lactate dehydrogenase [Coccidioides immitis RMSCC 3703]
MRKDHSEQHALEREERPTFKGQLYESTQQRIQRERAELERYARMQKDSSALRNTAITFTVLVTALGCYYLGSLRPAALPESSTTPLYSAPKPHHDTSPGNLQAAWSDFIHIVGKENVSTDKVDLDAHAGSDWSSYTAKESERPFLVVFPSTTEEVSRIMKVRRSEVWWEPAVLGPTLIDTERCANGYSH